MPLCPEIEFESLVNLSAQMVGRYMLDGTFENYKFHLQDDLSNVVYSELKRWEDPFTAKIADEFSRKLELTEVYIDYGEYDEHRCRTFKTQNTLKKVILFGLKTARDFHQTAIAEGSDELAIVDIVKLLESIISNESGETMRELAIFGKGTQFLQNDYTEKMHLMLPKLEHLTFFHLQFAPREFNSICRLFTCLQTLEFSNTSIGSLDGISNLANLELLNLCESIFNDTNDIKDLFELKKLRILNISAYEKTSQVHNFKHYVNHVKSGKALLELRMIDIGNNDLDLKDLQLLIKTHPQLQIINLISTPLETTSQLKLPNRKVELLTAENAHRCFKSLKHCFRLRIYIPSIMKLLKQCSNHMEFSKPTDEDYRECLMTVFPFTLCTYNIVRACAFKLLRHIVRKPQLFSYAEKQDLIVTIYHNLIEIFTITSYNSDEVDTFCEVKCMWFILQSDGFLETSVENINSICELAVKCLICTRNLKLLTPQYCLSVVEKLLGKMSPKRALVMAITKHLKSHLVDLLANHNHNSIGEDNIQKLFKVIQELTYMERIKRSDPLRIPIDEKCIVALMEKINDLNFEYKVQEPLINLSFYVQFIDTSVYSTFFQNFKKFLLPFLLAEKTQKQARVISLLGIMRCYEDRQAMQLTMETMNEICKLIHEYNRKEDDDLKVFKWIARKAELKEAAGWARWVAGRCGIEIEEAEEQEPVEKKMKS